MGASTLPLVSIVITSYNRAHWIRQAIESALAQDYPNLEIIISDNCSTDNSDEVIKSYCHDQRIRYSRNEQNIGMIANFQKAFFELAKGEYIANISSDDYLVNPRFISRAMNIVSKYENISIVFAIHQSLNEKTGILGANSLPGKFDIEFKKGKDVFFDYASNPYYSAAGAMYSVRHIRENNIGFSGRVTGDVEFNLQLMLAGNIGFINDLVYVVRVHDHNVTGAIKNIYELENAYIDVYKYLYEKVGPKVDDKKALNNWYRKIFFKRTKLCLQSVISGRNRKDVLSLNRLLLKKYKAKYLSFFLRHPEYIARIILNR
ncbi:MAG TPA: glycosyltransferase family 2 protein [Chitinophagaceae bacterium]|nr:glycosyltransferase family 2 protein [Chitinophagaceae bacterium]